MNKLLKQLKEGELFVETDLAVFLIKNEQNRINATKLRGCAISLYFEVQFAMKAGTQEIVLNKDEVMKRNKIKSATSFYSSIKQLVDIGLLKRLGYNKYEVNKDVMVCGYSAIDRDGKEYILASCE